MIIRNTRVSDLDPVMALYGRAREFMAENGNPDQWGTSYPGKELIEQDIRDGNSYVCEEDGRLIATFAYIPGDDVTYAMIFEGDWLDDSPYGVVHRITTDGTVKGTASFCLEWAVRQCGNLRIDTHRDNMIMQNLLKKNGFAYCGIIYIEDGSERLAYQKKLTDG
ncbi:MAG: GNAT family N-acetyltransferase [Actinobacteria bacterium]|nr:GNAT family N-acetyltransferase [Actinomycetota bacterium]